VERYFAGEAPQHSAFWLAEFRNDDRQIMLVIEEAFDSGYPITHVRREFRQYRTPRAQEAGHGA
jgi:hypothetical protein